MKSKEAHVTERSNFYNYSASANARDGLLYLVATGHFVYEPGYDLQRSSFDSFLAWVVVSGKMSIEQDGQTYTARTGDLVLLDCYKPHRYYTSEGCELLWAHFDGASARAYYNWVNRTNGIAFSHPNSHRVQAHLSKLFAIFHEKKPVDELKIARELTAVLSLMAEALEEGTDSRRNSDVMEEVVGFINAHLSEELSVEKLAKLANFSEYHFIRVFRDILGMTPRQYIISARINSAKYLLITSAMSISELAQSVGYASESMFCAAFKRYTGMTPSAYRSKINNMKRA